MNDAPKPPAGWYPTPEGGQRYWDGDAWSNLPAPPGDAAPRPARNRRTVWVVAIVVGVVLALGGAAAVVVSNLNASAEAQALEQERKQEQEQAERERQREEAAARAQEEADALERESRADTVADIEDAVKAMASEHADDEIIDAEPIEVSCSPVNGGSTDDLTEQTTVFSCFVATEDNGDGTMSGYTYHATMNWDSGEYSYGFGQP